MTSLRSTRFLLAAVLAGCASGGGAAAAPSDAQAAAEAGAAPSATTTTESALTGDWTWSASLADATLRGTWRLTYTGERWTGVVFRDDMPPSPVRSMRVSGRDFQFIVEWNGGEFTIRGRLQTAQTIIGQISGTGSVGRLTASRR